LKGELIEIGLSIGWGIGEAISPLTIARRVAKRDRPRHCTERMAAISSESDGHIQVLSARVRSKLFGFSDFNAVIR
jgi:hypothetical protein